jgi:hypothetical protein
MTSVKEKMRSLGVYKIWGEPTGPIDGDPVFAAIETEMQRPLPADYKEFVCEYGQCAFGDYVASPVEPRFPAATRCLVSVIYGLERDKGYFLLKERDMYRGRMADHFVQIAHDPGGNLFVLSCGSDDYGKVYYWDHEHVDLPRGRVTAMAEDLAREGVDARRLSIDQIVLEWDRRRRDELGRPPGYGNVYRVAESIVEFVDSLEPFNPDVT